MRISYKEKETFPVLNETATQQMVQIIKIVQEQRFYLYDFDIAEYGAENFQKFITLIERKIGHAAAAVVAFYMADGVRDWRKVAIGLDLLDLAKINCEIAIANNLDRNKTKADIVYEVLNGLNGRQPLAPRYDGENKTLMGLFFRILTGATRENEGRYLQADCKPLTVLFYSTMSALGEKTKIHLTEWIDEEKNTRHMYSALENGLDYEHTHDEDNYERRHERLKKIYDDQILDSIWPVIAEEMITVWLANKSMDTEKNIATLEQVRILDRSNLVVLGNLVPEYTKRLAEMAGEYDRTQGEEKQAILDNYINLLKYTNELLLEYIRSYVRVYEEIEKPELKKLFRENRIKGFIDNLVCGEEAISPALELASRETQIIFEQQLAEIKALKNLLVDSLTVRQALSRMI
ncbi:MAG: hypothetical protein LBQ83_04290 [Candidatus Margulisbacteria bacterium]|jgi:hypothetical protein|nr:hypothetical protein [Candidatus Margulisiibacteriota bacterium]